MCTELGIVRLRFRAQLFVNQRKRVLVVLPFAFAKRIGTLLPFVVSIAHLWFFECRAFEAVAVSLPDLTSDVYRSSSDSGVSLPVSSD